MRKFHKFPKSDIYDMYQTLRLNSVVASDKGHSVQAKKIIGSWLGRDDANFLTFWSDSFFAIDLGLVKKMSLIYFNHY